MQWWRISLFEGIKRVRSLPNVYCVLGTETAEELCWWDDEYIDRCLVRWEGHEWDKKLWQRTDILNCMLVQGANKVVEWHGSGFFFTLIN